jgi:hypothetical protein
VRDDESGMKAGAIGCGKVAHIHMSAYKAISKIDVLAS